MGNRARRAIVGGGDKLDHGSGVFSFHGLNQYPAYIVSYNFSSLKPRQNDWQIVPPGV